MQADPALTSDFEKLGAIQAEIDTLNSQLNAYMEEWESLGITLNNFYNNL